MAQALPAKLLEPGVFWWREAETMHKIYFTHNLCWVTFAEQKLCKRDLTDHDDNVALLVGVGKRLSSKSRALRDVSD